jgi:integrase
MNIMANVALSGVAMDWHWVGGFLAVTYGESSTGRNYTRNWGVVRRFLELRQVCSIASISRHICNEYVLYRVGQGARRITARHELKVLSVILNEAVDRNLIPHNPLHGLRIRVEPRLEKPEITPAMEAETRALIALEPWHREFLQISFDIGMLHGRRISETRVKVSDVDLERGVITFQVKGGKAHTTQLHPKLVPLFTRLKKKGQEWSFDFPDRPDYMSQIWTRFFKRHGLSKRHPNLCSHCFRVTAVTRLARANVSEAKAMRYVGHASEDIHRIYMRLHLGDVTDCVAAL